VLLWWPKGHVNPSIYNYIELRSKTCNVHVLGCNIAVTLETTPLDRARNSNATSPFRSIWILRSEEYYCNVNFVQTRCRYEVSSSVSSYADGIDTSNLKNASTPSKNGFFEVSLSGRGGRKWGYDMYLITQELERRWNSSLPAQDSLLRRLAPINVRRRLRLTS